MKEHIPYNPLAKRHLAASIVSKLLRQEPHELPPARFEGAGIYLLYYTGAFEHYEPIACANRNGNFAMPIYVGKAVPAGSRKGGEGLDTPHGDALQKRLAKHAESIKSASSTLKLPDFRCRWLVVDEVFITLGETMLISHFKPVWNLVVDGFGNNPPGGRRETGKKPMWDIIHPGRPWAAKMSAAISSKEIIARIREHFRSVPPPAKDLEP